MSVMKNLENILNRPMVVDWVLAFLNDDELMILHDKVEKSELAVESIGTEFFWSQRSKRRLRDSRNLREYCVNLVQEKEMRKLCWNSIAFI